MRAAGGGGRPGPAEGSKRKEARVCGPLSENRSVTCTSCPRRRIFSLPRPAAFVKRKAHHTGGLTARRPGTALPGHRATDFPAALGAAVILAPEAAPRRKAGPAQPHPARLCRAIPGKALLAPALPEMTPGRPRGAGHPLDALGWPLWGQPPAVCSVCLPRLRGPEITGPLRCGGRRVPHRATLRKGRDPGPVRGRGADAPLRRLSRCGCPRSAPPHRPAQRGARRHSACGSSRGPS